MKTIEERKVVTVKGREVDFGTLLHQYESDKLIQEMQTLIKKKGLKVDLVPGEGAPTLGEPLLASGCDSCTVCPCMICW
ncbi:hypothetical protein Amn_pc01240 (plasmid) [Aminobacter sp. Y103A]|uniref:hypothetical protein n=1 Tax=Phyllobacteriaceae TaxID=69277 RepID=UPI0018EB1CA1|nr:MULTISPECIES: hypothetical protein [Phyllobacteriaceae]BBD41409.1 hypothetical protein Amn_pc01240 [Aminobacter sp. SS-2016]BCH20037.1 hypothetical protein MesoLjLa_68880 [Mesorhizobium sp. L-2-11]